MDKDGGNFARVMRNCQRYRFYGREAKMALKSMKKLEENFNQTWFQTEHFLAQLASLCICKRDNILLSDLGQDILIMKSDFQKINNRYKSTFSGLKKQLIQIGEQFNGVEKIENKYKDAHQHRIKYERRSKGIGRLIARAFSFKAQQTDFVSLSNSQTDYLQQNDLGADYTTGRLIDRKLAKLVNDEISFEKTLVTQCLNQELAIVIRIRKLVRLFAENQIEYERDLITLWSQLDLITERGVPEAILGLNNKELEEYFRPNRRRLLPSYYATAAAVKNDQLDKNAYFRNANKLDKSHSLDSYKNQVMNKLLASRSPDQLGKSNKNNLYYGSLCSLNEKPGQEKAMNNCQLCSNQNTVNQQPNVISINQTASPDATTQIESRNPSNPFYETNFHKCRLNHRTNAEQAFNLDELQNIDLTMVSMSPAASAPPIDTCPDDRIATNDRFDVAVANGNRMQSVEQRPIEQRPIEQRALERRSDGNQQDRSQSEANGHSWLSQDKTYCNECKNYQCKVEEAALAFVNNYRCFKSKVESCEKYRKYKELDDQLPKGY